MSGITSILDIARGALATQKNALEVTGHNVANVNTPGYSVQKTILETNMPVPMAYGVVGTGVKTLEIRRTYCQFLNDQLNEKNSLMHKWEAQKDTLGVLETEFNESAGVGINQMLSDFWNAWEDVANNPEGLGERSALVAKSTALVEAFNSKARQLDNMQEDLDAYITAAIGEVNRCAEQLADLNEKIMSVENENIRANDSRDQRDQILEKLAEYLPVRYLETSQGTISVFLPGGYALVEGTSPWLLDTQLNSQNSLRVIWNNSADMTTRLDQGKLGGWLELRDSIIPKYQETLDGLAAHLAIMVNSQHQQGYGQDDVTGRDFFSYEPTLMALADSENRGNATFTAGFAGGAYDSNLVSGDNYDLSFSGSGLDTLTITNRSTGQAVSYVRAGNTYTFDGLEITVSGTQQPGDQYLLKANWNMAGNLALNSAVAIDPTTVAAAGQPTAPGDNTNAMAITNLRYREETILRQTSTLSEIYDSSLVGEIGTDAGNAVNRYEYNQVIVQQITTRRDSVAGVSLDEEMTNMIKFQQAFSAAARLITLTDEMLETVLNTRR